MEWHPDWFYLGREGFTEKVRSSSKHLAEELDLWALATLENNDNNRCGRRKRRRAVMSAGKKPHGAGRSTFEFVDLEQVLQAVSLTPQTVFLDLGCGAGNYTIPVAQAIGPLGRVYGVDAWQEGLDELKSRAAAKGLHNIETIHADLNEHIPVGDGKIDVCFMATVLHDLLRDDSGEKVLREIDRVLKPGGRLSIIEFKKVEDGPGPPQSVRLSPEQTEKVVAPIGFTKDRVIELGPFHYMLIALSARQRS